MIDSCSEESSEDIFNEEYEEKKCDYCNCSLHDCSLCGVSSFDEVNGVPIC